MGWEEY